MKFGIIIVLYNTLIKESETYLSIKEHLDKIKCDILFVDNSTNDEKKNNKLYSEDNGFNYMDMNGNVGLSKAYNCGIEFFKKSNIDYLILFDSDTKVLNSYFDGILKINKSTNTIFLPVMKNKQGDIVTPTAHSKNIIIDHFLQSKNKKMEQIKKLEKNHKLFGINSGMIISFDIFIDYKYNEKIFLDCVDNNFMFEMNKQKKNIKLLEGEIYQSFDVESLKDNGFSSNMHRISIRLKDLKAYSRGNYFLNKITIVVIYILKTKDLSYLKLIFKKIK